MLHVRIVCPFCYHRINRFRLWFVCTGNPAPGFAKCEQRVNRRKLDETDIEEAAFPVFAPPRRLWSPRRARCPWCRGRTGRLACPCCNSRLPSNVANSFSSSPVIAMAGARSTGKTVYLTVLADLLTGPIRKRFRANVSPYGDDGRAWLAASVDSIIKQGVLPVFTEQPTGRSEPLVFEWRRRTGWSWRSYRSSFLSFLDTAGESLGTQHGAEELKFLAKVDAFIVLLDPFALPGLPERIGLPPQAQTGQDTVKVLDQVTQVLREEHGISPGRRIKVPVAVVFAKIDALRDYLTPQHPIFRTESKLPCYDETAGMALHESIREILRDLGADDVDDLLHANYKTFRYFAVSALGRPPDYGRNRVAEGGVRPHRVSEPLVWLLNYYKIVPGGNGNG